MRPAKTEVVGVGVIMHLYSTSIRRRLRRQWLLTAMLVGGPIIAMIIEFAARAWTIFHDIAAVKEDATPAVVAVGISADDIFLKIVVAGLILSVVTAVEALWRRLRLTH